MLPNKKFTLINRLLKKITSIQHDQQQRRQNANDICQQQQQQKSKQNWLNWFSKICMGDGYIDDNNNNNDDDNDHHHNNQKSELSIHDIRQYFRQYLHRKDIELLLRILDNEHYIGYCIKMETTTTTTNNNSSSSLQLKILYWLIENIRNVKLIDIDNQLIRPLPWCRLYNNNNNNNENIYNSHHNHHSNSTSSLLCMNPNHWAVLIAESDYHQQYYNDWNDDDINVNNNDDHNESKDLFGNCETITMPSSSSNCCDSLNKQQQQKRTKKWARLSYWEYKQRKITDINVRNSTIGICHPENIDDNDESIEFIPISSLLRQQQQQINHQIRMKIGTNVILFLDQQQNVWLYNRSKLSSIFIESPLYCKSSSSSSSTKTTSTIKNVVKILPGHFFKAYDYQLSHHYRSSSSSSFSTRKDDDSFRFSFVKGFGDKYKLNDITDCPCWMEVILFF
uniref:Mothers against decapentaplegic homolog 6-like isoform X1 n=1 Tax=Dermatophagoides pteronyssinus TaxID=6956 RepID=A0A6P6Y370_DERPT|nr:mothers against decapentaplegic homolog 6-like isoform X1 [Dermatophagoides pteronyssinus]